MFHSLNATNLFGNNKVWNAQIHVDSWHLCSFSLPLLASSSAFSFPKILACARTLYSVVGWFLCCSSLTISCNMVLSGWLLCSVRCFICVLIT